MPHATRRLTARSWACSSVEPPCLPLVGMQRRCETLRPIEGVGIIAQNIPLRSLSKCAMITPQNPILIIKAPSLDVAMFPMPVLSQPQSATHYLDEAKTREDVKGPASYMFARLSRRTSPQEVLMCV